MDNSNELYKLIEKNPDKAIERLLELSDSTPSIKDDIITIKRRAEEVKKSKLRGLMAQQELLVEEAKIVDSLLELVKNKENNSAEESNIDRNPISKEDEKKTFLKLAMQISLGTILTASIGLTIYLTFEYILTIIIVILVIYIMSIVSKFGGS